MVELAATLFVVIVVLNVLDSIIYSIATEIPHSRYKPPTRPITAREWRAFLYVFGGGMLTIVVFVTIGVLVHG
jgi:hypothetical protein